MRVELQHVSKSFPHNGATVEALQDISLTVEEGEFVCLLGPSGCGKSTIVHLIAGLEAPSAGQILVDGVPVAGPDPSRTVVFQDAALFPWLDVLGNVEFGLRMAGLPKSERQERAAAYIRLVHLSKFMCAMPHQLSGGMRQRVAIARALAMEPKLLLMDEPFGALDAQTRAVLQEELLEIWQKTHRTIFFVTHNVREATGLADRVYTISARPGRIKEVDRIEIPRPRHAEHPVLLSYQRKILASLGEEIATVMQEELGEAVHVPETAHPVAPDRSLGMHI
ncbi:MAG: ABC transporter ATP-binding protein [Candidatus Omnitrophica bacterium]|nr:ABC transporter ATP-binding protein [Candidatus Omnitrophota bacterium]